MEKETANHLWEIMAWLVDHWETVILTLGLMAGAVMWSINQYLRRYATVAAVRELESRNTEQHDEIKMHIGEIKTSIEKKHTEILQTILHMHKRGSGDG